MTLGAGLNRAQTSETDPASSLTWDSEPLTHDLDVVGDIEVQLDAASTTADTAWIAILQDVDANGAVIDVTAGSSGPACVRSRNRPPSLRPRPSVSHLSGRADR
jgi:predicted acyl esterase